MITILQAQGQGAGWVSMVLPFLLMFVVFYFFMIRPQMRKQKEEKNFQENLNKGTRIVTAAGIHGKIADVLDDGVILETMAGKIKVEKSAISRELTVARYPENAPVKEKK
ncbi:MAG: preprotein translocase subunit YajC [Flavobacteriaceae bacterium]|jgi:preprotein translocase subunit YajC|nr:preprotein translocase subunit YajC [Flavobacteriaceae bacterium]